VLAGADDPVACDVPSETGTDDPPSAADTRVPADSRDPAGDTASEPDRAMLGEAAPDTEEADHEADRDADPGVDAVGLWAGESSPISVP
jgi:hypothetical protein